MSSYQQAKLNSESAGVHISAAPMERTTAKKSKLSLVGHTSLQLVNSVYNSLCESLNRFLFLHWWRRKSRANSHISTAWKRPSASSVLFFANVKLFYKILFPFTIFLPILSLILGLFWELLFSALSSIFQGFRLVLFSHHHLRMLYSSIFDIWNPEQPEKQQMFYHGRKTLVLDLDETLVHSTTRQNSHFDIRLEVSVDNSPSIFYVNKRPYLDIFLQVVSQWYDLVVYTASLKKYADPLIDALDVHGVIRERYFRDHCIQVGNNFVKDISIIEPDLRKIVIIDNSPSAYVLHEENAIPIGTWWDDPLDEELLNLLPFLQALCVLADVRSILSLRETKGVLLHNLVSSGPYHSS
jgi:CTD nuclear envelope phosphatase 1